MHSAIYPVASLHLPGSSPTRQSAGIQGRVAGIVSRLAGPDAAGAVHVRRQRSPPPAMPCQPRWSPPDPQQPWPCPAGTPPTTTPTVNRGWLRRHQPRAVAVVASWRRPGVPEPPPSWPLRQPTAPAAALPPGPKADRPRRTYDRASARLPYRTAALANCARVRVCAFRSSGMLAVVIGLLRAPYSFPNLMIFSPILPTDVNCLLIRHRNCPPRAWGCAWRQG